MMMDWMTRLKFAGCGAMSLVLVAALPALAGSIVEQLYDGYDPSDLRYATRDDRRIPTFINLAGKGEDPNAEAIRANIVDGLSSPSRNYLRFEDATGRPDFPPIRLFVDFTGPRSAYAICQGKPLDSQSIPDLRKVSVHMCRGERPVASARASLPDGDPTGEEWRERFKQISNAAFPQRAPKLTQLERQQYAP